MNLLDDNTLAPLPDDPLDVAAAKARLRAHAAGLPRPAAPPAKPDATFVNTRTPADDAEARHLRARTALYQGPSVHEGSPSAIAQADAGWNETNRNFGHLMNSTIDGVERDTVKRNQIDAGSDNLAVTAAKALSERKKFPKKGQTPP